MAATLSRVAVIGAGGNLGPFIVAALKKNPQFKITVITRQSSDVKFEDPALSVVKVADDYPASDMENAFKGQDAVVATFNHKANSAQHAMVDAAVKAGVKRFIPADFGSNGESEAVMELFPPLRMKKAAIDYCRSKESDTFSWTSIVTGLFVDVAIKNGFMGYNLKDRTATIWDSGDGKFSCSARHTIGTTVAQVLAQPEKSKNRYVYTSSFETSQNAILASLEKHLDTKFTVNPVTSDDMIAQGKEGFAKGDFVGMGKLALAASYSGKYGGDFVKAGVLANEEFDVPRENLDEVVGEVLKKAGLK